MKLSLFAVTIVASVCLGSFAANAKAGAPPVLEESAQLEGRPRVLLTQLSFPQDLPDAPLLERHLRSSLARHARRMDWGVGRGHKIEYKFTVELLGVERQGKLLRVSCRATGSLPKGKRARSEISFGGDPQSRDKLIRRVMDIVAEGVIGRLAEMERGRRGQD